MRSTNAEVCQALLIPLYDAATNSELWPVFLEKLAQTTRADKVAIMLHSPNGESRSLVASLGVSAELRRDLERIIVHNPWVAELRKHRAPGAFCGSPEDAVALKEFRKSPFYRDLFPKHEIEWVAVAVIIGVGGWAASLTVSRPASGSRFDKPDKELLRSLLPHLETVFKMKSAMGALHERSAALQHALDLMGAACITLDALGRPLSINRRAEAFIGDGSVLRIKGKRLVALNGQQRELDNCLMKACACGAGRSSEPGDGALVMRALHGRTLYLSMLPYRPDWGSREGRPTCVLFITTPEEVGPGEHRLWRAMFGLAPAECRVAEMMKQGMEAAEISEAIRIKVDTVRYYQKSVYRKTGVRGQGQLIRLLTRLPSASP